MSYTQKRLENPPDCAQGPGHRGARRRLALLPVLGCIIMSRNALAQTPSKEYIRLGDRVIAIETPAPAFSVSPPSVTLPGGGASGTISVTASGAWTATSGSGWITVSNGSGTGNGTFSYSVGASTVDHSGTIVVTGPGGQQTVAVTQQAVSTTPLVTTLASGDRDNQTFTFRASDSNGVEAISQLHVLFNTFLDSWYACYLYYDRTSRSLVLLGDLGQWTGQINFDAAGLYSSQSGVLHNGQCTIVPGA